MGVVYRAARPCKFICCIALSKLANVLYAKELQRKLKTEGIPITVMAVDPGSVMTGISTLIVMICIDSL